LQKLALVITLLPVYYCSKPTAISFFHA